MDRDFNGDHWFYPRLGLFRYSGLCQELLPGRIGMVSGLFFGFAFGMGGLGAAVLGLLADHTSIELVYKICAFLPLLGFLTIFLPDNRQKA
jgi:FSR family fosmidomycin resistance protein-like MFS transporter